MSSEFFEPSSQLEPEVGQPWSAFLGRIGGVVHSIRECARRLASVDDNGIRRRVFPDEEAERSFLRSFDYGLDPDGYSERGEVPLPQEIDGDHGESRETDVKMIKLSDEVEG
jgi:hypothetical protein